MNTLVKPIASMQWLLAFTLLLSAFGCSNSEISRHLSEEGINEIDGFLQSKVDAGDVPGVVAIVANKDEILYHGSFGKLDVTNDVDMPKDAIFHVASMTKPITSVAIMMLYEEGRIGLDDPISKYLPSWSDREVLVQLDKIDTTFTAQPAEREITIRDLLSHTSGLGYGFSNNELKMLQEKTGKSVRELPLLHEPGSKWTYGMSTRLLGNVISEVTGEPFQVFFQNRIFDQLGMEDTFYEVPDEKLQRYVTLHRRVQGSLKEDDEKNMSVFIAGDGGLRSTASDYIKFLQMLMNGGDVE